MVALSMVAANVVLYIISVRTLVRARGLAYTVCAQLTWLGSKEPGLPGVVRRVSSPLKPSLKCLGRPLPLG